MGVMAIRGGSNESMKYTFGRTLAAQRLAALVKDNPKARRKISSILGIFTYRMLNISKIRDPELIKLCWELLRDNTLQRLDAKTGLSKEMQTYAKNVLIYRYRVYLHNLDYLVQQMKKQGLTFPQEGV